MDEWNVALEEEVEEEEQVIWTPDGKVNLDDSSDESSEYSDDFDDDFSDLSIRNRSKKDSSKGSSNGIWNRFSKLIGNKPLEESDVISVLKDFENLLSGKNVANVIAT